MASIFLMIGIVYTLYQDKKNLTIENEIYGTPNPFEDKIHASERGVDYQRLERLLQQRKWAEADSETGKLMLEITRQNEVVYPEDIAQFPTTDLQTINWLWEYYSEGKFGFSVQAKIYYALGNGKNIQDENFEQLWQQFGDEVGWRKDGKWLQYADFGFTFDLESAKRGYLPSVAIVIGHYAKLYGNDSWLNRGAGVYKYILARPEWQEDVSSNNNWQLLPSSKNIVCGGFSDSRQVAVSPNGQLIACNNDKIRLYNTENGNCQLTIDTKSSLYRIIFTENSRYLIGFSGYTGGYNISFFSNLNLFIWDVVTGERIKPIDYAYTEISAGIINETGNLIALLEKEKKKRFKKIQKPQIRIVNAFLGKTVQTLEGENLDLLRQIVFSPDNRFLVNRYCKSWDILSELEIWNVKTGKLINEISIDYTEGDTDSGCPDHILFSPDGQILAIPSVHNITLWEITTGKKIHTVERYHQGWDSCLAFSPNGTILAFSTMNLNHNIEIKFLDLTTFTETTLNASGFYYKVNSLNFGGDGKMLVASYTNGNIRIWKSN